jgi:hypothetical protein
MKTNSPTARAILACTAALLAMTAVSPALAQSPDSRPPAPAAQGQAYDDNGQYYYDSCRRDTNSRAAGGGLIGLAAGAVAGSNLAGRHNRNEGTILGGVVGALIGSQVGKSMAACEPTYQPAPAPRAYYSRPAYRYDSYYGGPVYDRPVPPPPPPPPSYYDNGPAATDQGCQNVESRIRMPDGRTQTRLVKTCPDRNGNYQIVD